MLRAPELQPFPWHLAGCERLAYHGRRMGRMGKIATWSSLAIALVACSGKIEPGGDTAHPGRGGAQGDGSAASAGSGSGADGGVDVPGDGTGGNSADGAAFVASASVARRLSRAEFDNSVRDLLGDDTHPATRLLSEELYSPYDNDYAAQTASGALIDSLEALATDVAGRVIADAAMRARIVTCTPKSAGDVDCFREIVSGFTQRAFRRP